MNNKGISRADAESILIQFGIIKPKKKLLSLFFIIEDAGIPGTYRYHPLFTVEDAGIITKKADLALFSEKFHKEESAETKKRIERAAFAALRNLMYPPLLYGKRK